ncbi:hypothetical protein [Streptomyces sp. CAU 1734]|uniref:hypothetical protein n=1 Tax=Streptomyces sp. CAU 1734 TaxID=3140360 RepID=UPI00326052C2
MRRVMGAVYAVSALGLLSGCSPAKLPLAAVWMGEDGKPAGEIRPCDGDRAAHVALRGWGTDESAVHPSARGESDPDSSTTPAEGAEDSGWKTSGVHRGASFALFAPPPSWRVETTGVQAPAPGHTYVLGFKGPHDGWNPYDGEVHFTADDLASLDPGQVWADGRVMSRDAFAELVDEKC